MPEDELSRVQRLAAELDAKGSSAANHVVQLLAVLNSESKDEVRVRTGDVPPPCASKVCMHHGGASDGDDRW